MDTIDTAAIDMLVTLCAEEVCPVLPGKAKRLHWPIADPAAHNIDLSREEVLTHFRTARDMLEKAWRRGDIDRGSWVVEASSGSTSLALALACAQLDLRFLAVMPQGVSNERLLGIRA